MNHSINRKVEIVTGRHSIDVKVVSIMLCWMEVSIRFGCGTFCILFSSTFIHFVYLEPFSRRCIITSSFNLVLNLQKSGLVACNGGSSSQEVVNLDLGVVRCNLNLNLGILNFSLFVWHHLILFWISDLGYQLNTLSFIPRLQIVPKICFRVLPLREDKALFRVLPSLLDSFC